MEDKNSGTQRLTRLRMRQGFGKEDKSEERKCEMKHTRVTDKERVKHKVEKKS